MFGEPVQSMSLLVYKLFEKILKEKLGSTEDYENLAEDEKLEWATLISGIVITLQLVNDMETAR